MSIKGLQRKSTICAWIITKMAFTHSFEVPSPAFITYAWIVLIYLETSEILFDCSFIWVSQITRSIFSMSESETAISAILWISRASWLPAKRATCEALALRTLLIVTLAWVTNYQRIIKLTWCASTGALHTHIVAIQKISRQALSACSWNGALAICRAIL